MTDQELKWWHVRWRLAGRAITRIAIVLGKIVGVLCLVAGTGYGVIYLTSPWLVSQRMIKVDPRLSIVPAELPTKAGAPLSNATIDLYGFRVSLPNDEVTRTVQGDSITMILFRNGGNLMIHNPSHASAILESAISDRVAQKLVGQEAIQSKFKLMQAAMGATPEQAKWWRFHNFENERIEFPLLAKFSLLTGFGSPHAFTLGPIYTISAGGFRGFQIGYPDDPPYEAHLDLFDGADRHFAFDVIGREGHGQVLTQAEINAVVASIQPTADH